MASQSGYNDAGSSGHGVISSVQLGSADLRSKRLLGTGLASVVYETEVNGEKFARKDFIGVPSRIFEKEAAVLVGLEDHINVVKTVGWTENKMSCSLVLEYVDDDLVGLLQKRKQSLKTSPEAGPSSGKQSDRTSDPPFELREAVDIMEQIARGMEHLHDQGIPHGDLKTKNILVTHRDQLKVADFGLVRTKRKSTSFASRQARKLDMARWKAPEILEVLLAEDNDETSSESDSESSDEECAGSSGRVTDLRLLDDADVYSFAVTCCQILTGEDPYPNSNWRELMASIVAGELRPTLPAACPLLLRDLLVSCWSRKSHRRGGQAALSSRPTFSFIRWNLERLRQALSIKSVDFYRTSHPRNLATPVIDYIKYLIEKTWKAAIVDAEYEIFRQMLDLILLDVLEIEQALCISSADHSGYQERMKDWLRTLQRALHNTAIEVHKCTVSNPYKRDEAFPVLLLSTILLDHLEEINEPWAEPGTTRKLLSQKRLERALNLDNLRDFLEQRTHLLSQERFRRVQNLDNLRDGELDLSFPVLPLSPFSPAASDRDEIAEFALERYLFRKYSAVYINGLSQLATNINLLDVLIKNTKGLVPPRPVMKRAGSMIGLGTASSEEVENILRQVLKCFEQDREGELFGKRYPPDIKLRNASAKSLSGSLLAQFWTEVEAHLSNAKNLTLRLRGLETACVDKDKIVKFVNRNQWKPKIDDERLDWPDQPNFLRFGRDGRQLWVIHQILYASELEVTSGAWASAGAKVKVVPGVLGAGVSVSRDSDPNVLHLTVGTNSKFPPGKFMFAFRAICFRFDAKGELVGTFEDVRLPLSRGYDETPYDDDRAQIRDLFLEEPPEVDSDTDGEDDDQDWDASILPIE